MTWRAVALLVAVGCGKGSDKTPAAGSDLPVTDWPACEVALAAAPHSAELGRLHRIVTACNVCDWSSILGWSTPHTEGGPTSAQVDQAMIACDAFCDGTSKERFLATLDDARGSAGSEAPWRYLGKQCKARFGTAPDGRFSSPPMFALDHTARAVAAHGDAKLLDAIHVALPARSISGSGLTLATAKMLDPELPAIQVTITPTEIRTGPLPRAQLGANGVVVELGADPYPGKLVPAMPHTGTPYAVFAPRDMPAARLVDALPAPASDVRIAAFAPADLPNWGDVGVIPIELAAAPTDRIITLDVALVPHAALVVDPASPVDKTQPIVVTINDTDTMAQLVAALDTLASAGWKRVSISHPPK